MYISITNQQFVRHENNNLSFQVRIHETQSIAVPLDWATGNLKWTDN